MLIITRRTGEKVMIGDEVVVHVLQVVGNSVRIGIDAPRSIRIYREEIWNALRDEKSAAAQASASVHPPTGTVK